MSIADCFLKIDGIDGESKDATHKGAIEVRSWSWAQNQSITSSGNGPHQSGVAIMGRLTCTFGYNKASPKLSLACKRLRFCSLPVQYCHYHYDRLQ